MTTSWSSSASLSECIVSCGGISTWHKHHLPSSGSYCRSADCTSHLTTSAMSGRGGSGTGLMYAEIRRVPGLSLVDSCLTVSCLTA